VRFIAPGSHGIGESPFNMFGKVWNAKSGRLLATARVGLVRGLGDRFF